MGVLESNERNGEKRSGSRREKERLDVRLGWCTRGRVTLIKVEGEFTLYSTANEGSKGAFEEARRQQMGN